MDDTARYLELAGRGREAFIGAAAPAALVRRRSAALRTPRRPITTARLSQLNEGEETLISGLDGVFGAPDDPPEDAPIEIYPLAKKPGAPFSAMITVGRTANNDVVLNDITVSRFHAFFRHDDDSWIVCDAGSKNGTELDGARLDTRRERPVSSGAVVRIGDVETTFYTVDELFAVIEAL